MTKTIQETYQFGNLAELRDWLNDFKITDLSTWYFENSDGVMLDDLKTAWVTETLSDGSTVNQLRVYGS